MNSVQGPRTAAQPSRVQRARNELITSLYRQQGPFWHAVNRVRDDLLIEPTVGLPEPRELQHVPPLPPIPLAKLPLPKEDAPEGGVSFRSFFLRVEPTLREHYAEYSTRWDFALFNLIFNFVLQSYRDDPTWRSFMALCVKHDPPPDRLLQFAELVAQGSSAGNEQFAIRPLYDTGAVLYFADRFASLSIRHVLEDLASRLLAAGIDVSAFDVNEYKTAPLLLHEEWSAYEQSATSAIVVGPETSKDDVDAAFSQLHALNPERAHRGPGRLPRDPLWCLQAAVWADDCGWTQGQIADRLGLRRTEDEYRNRRRSSSVAGHIKEGRRLRGTRKTKPKKVPGS